MKTFGSNRGMLLNVRHRTTAEQATRFWEARGNRVSPITEYRYLVKSGIQGRSGQNFRMAFKYQIMVYGEIPKRDYMAFIHSIQDPPGWVYDEGGPDAQG